MEMEPPAYDWTFLQPFCIHVQEESVCVYVKFVDIRFRGKREIRCLYLDIDRLKYIDKDATDSLTTESKQMRCQDNQTLLLNMLKRSRSAQPGLRLPYERRTAVTTHLKSEQLLLFVFVVQHRALEDTGIYSIHPVMS